MKSLKQIQGEVYNWSLHNFGDQPSWRPLLGINEELGELQEALLSKDLDLIQDSIADFGIYLLDFSAREYLSLETWSCPEIYYSGECIKNLLIYTGKLNHAFLKKSQGIRAKSKEYDLQIARHIFTLLHILSVTSVDITKVDFLELINRIWEKVRQRDWKKNPTSGSVSTYSEIPGEPSSHTNSE